MFKFLKFILLSVFTLFPELFLRAQFSATTYTEIGENNASEGLNIKAAAIGKYNYKNISIESGFQTDIISNNSNIISGINLKVSKEFLLKKFSVEIQPLILFAPFSDLIQETNYGLLFKMKFPHILFDIGTNFRKIGYTSKLISELGFVPVNINWIDNWNLMYSLTYNLNKKLSLFNVGYTITNTDNFSINQMTLPMINFHGLYKISNKIDLFAETWFKTAGSLNLHANYFGFIVRTGFILNLK